MQVKAGAFIVDFRGKAGGQIIKQNRAGLTLQNISLSNVERTENQRRPMRILTYISGYWRNLTQVQRDSWIDAIPYFPRTTKTGEPLELSPYNCFVSCNWFRYRFGYGILETWGPPPAVTPISTVTNMIVTSGSGACQIYYTPTPTDVFLRHKIYFSREYSQSVSIPANNWWLVGILAVDVASPRTFSSLVNKYFPNRIAGNKFFWRLVPICIVTGNEYAMLTGEVIVT